MCTVAGKGSMEGLHFCLCQKGFYWVSFSFFYTEDYGFNTYNTFSSFFFFFFFSIEYYRRVCHIELFLRRKIFDTLYITNPKWIANDLDALQRPRESERERDFKLLHGERI